MNDGLVLVHMALLRSEEELTSKEVMEVTEGMRVVVRGHGKGEASKRLFVYVPGSDKSGWISSVAKNGQTLVKREDVVSMTSVPEDGGGSESPRNMVPASPRGLQSSSPRLSILSSVVSATLGGILSPRSSSKRLSSAQPVETPGVKARFTVDNSSLKSKADGIGLRKSKRLDDTDDFVMTWGCTLEGFDEGDGWVKVQHAHKDATCDHYLPVAIRGHAVLKRLGDAKRRSGFREMFSNKTRGRVAKAHAGPHNGSSSPAPPGAAPLAHVRTSVGASPEDSPQASPRSGVSGWTEHHPLVGQLVPIVPAMDGTTHPGVVAAYRAAEGNQPEAVQVRKEGLQESVVMSVKEVHDLMAGSSAAKWKLADDEKEDGWNQDGHPYCGARVQRIFKNGPVHGTVVAWHEEGPDFRVIHDDGDEEDLTQEEVQKGQQLHAESIRRSASCQPQALSVSMLKATGLKSMNTAGDAPWCECQVQGDATLPHAGKRHVRTDAVRLSLAPVWNATHDLSAWLPSESLLFVVYDQLAAGSTVMGTAVLPGQSLISGTFNGALLLQGEGAEAGAELFVRVEVTP